MIWYPIYRSPYEIGDWPDRYFRLDMTKEGEVRVLVLQNRGRDGQYDWVWRLAWRDFPDEACEVLERALFQFVTNKGGVKAMCLSPQYVDSFPVEVPV